MWGFQGTICKKEKNFPIFTKYRWVHIPSVNLTKSARNSSFPNLKNQNERGIKSTEIRKRANSNRWIRSRRLCLGHKDMGHKVNINVSFHWQARWWACQNEIVWNAKFNERRELTNDNSSWQIVRLFAEHPALRSEQDDVWHDRVIGQRMETGAQSTVTTKVSRLHNKCNKSLLHVNFWQYYSHISKMELFPTVKATAASAVLIRRVWRSIDP